MMTPFPPTVRRNFGWYVCLLLYFICLHRSDFKHCQDEFTRLSRQVGYDFDIFPHLDGWLQNAGFSDVETTQKVLPVGTWPKDKGLKTLGRYTMYLFVDSGLEAYSYAVFPRQDSRKPEEVKDLLNKVSKEILSNKMHIYSHLYVFPYFWSHGAEMLIVFLQFHCYRQKTTPAMRCVERLFDLPVGVAIAVASCGCPQHLLHVIRGHHWATPVRSKFLCPWTTQCDAIRFKYPTQTSTALTAS